MADELSGWKDIAGHLGVSVRTAQLWAREQGLPVRRPGGARGRVLADREALSVWLASGPSVPSVVSQRRGVVLGVLGVLVVLVVAVFVWRPWVGRPSVVRVSSRMLTALDDRGRVVWERSLPSPIDVGLTQQEAVVAELDGDLRVMVVLFPAVHGDGPDVLVCYDRRGNEVWRFAPGKLVRTRREVFAPPYGIRRFLVTRFRDGGSSRIVVTGNHYLWWANPVTILSATGTVLREYWHSGHLSEIAVTDLDRDGNRELVLGGVSRGHARATLVVLDPETMTGASVEPPDSDYQLLGFAPGVEKARLLFPRSCMNLRSERFNLVHQLWTHPDTITVEVFEQILNPKSTAVLYTLNHDLTLTNAAPSTWFRTLHRSLELSKDLDHTMNADDEQQLHQIHYLTRLPGTKPEKN